MRLVNMKGMKYGRWLVLDRASDYIDPSGRKTAAWSCVCECGTARVILGTSLRHGSTSSCGCVRAENNRKRLWKGVGDLSQRYWGALRCGAKTRGYAFEVTIEYGWELFVQQNKRCVLTKVPLVMASNTNDLLAGLQTASLDRVDNSAGYKEGNVRWVHKAINQMRMDLNDTDFIIWCQLVVKAASGESNDDAVADVGRDESAGEQASGVRYGNHGHVGSQKRGPTRSFDVGVGW